MSNCSSIDPLVTPYIDGELPAADSQVIIDHIRVCAPCRARVSAERAVRAALEDRRPALCSDRAPAALRDACTRLSRPASDGATSRNRGTRGTRRVFWSRASAGSASSAVTGWRRRLAPVALAASLVLLVGAAFLYRMTQTSTRFMVAELTADHMKCFMLNAVLGTSHSQSVVESSLASGFGWQVHLPERVEDAGLELVGARPCLYGEGKIAHIMFKHRGNPVSVFMLPRDQRPEQVLEVLGHEASIWTEGDRTFVLIARESRAELDRLSSFVHASLK
jgi:anti-sigma factor RsiW